MGKFLTRFWNEEETKKIMEMDVTLLLFSMPDKKVVNDPDFRIPEVNMLTKLW